VAVTKSDISKNFLDARCETFGFLEGRRLSLVYDNFLSRLESFDELSVIESPIISQSNAKDIIFSQAKIKIEKGLMDISRPSAASRPIYYHVNCEGDFYCSTHISMLRQAGVPLQENIAVLPEYFVFRFIMPPQTLFKNIYQLSEGTRLQVQLCNGKFNLKEIREFEPKNSNNLDAFKDFREKCASLISKSITPLYNSRERIAVLLSGGLDSSLLLKICQNLNFQIKETYSSGWSFEPFEKEYAISSADSLGVNNKYFEAPMEKYVSGLVEGISAAEHPLVNMQSVLVHFLFKEGIPKSKDIILSGVGAELSCNGTNYSVYNFSKNPLKIRFLKLMSKIPILSNWRGAKWVVKYQSRIDCGFQDPNSVLWSQDPIGSFQWVANHFNVNEQDIIKTPLNIIEQFGEHSLFEIVALYDFIGANHATEATWSLLGEKQKRIVYYPFNNWDVINYFFSIPSNIAYKTYKYLLKQVAFYCGLPSFLINRRKLGFNPLTNLDVFMKYAFEPIIPLASKEFSDVRKIKPLDQGYDFWTLWNILNYSIWKRLMIDNQSVESLLEELKVL